MNTAEVECILRRTMEGNIVQFAGVYAADSVPSVLECPSCLVVNTDPARRPGEHWVAYYAKTPTDVEFFDSYGLPVDAYPHIRLPYKITKQNVVSLQAMDSIACGHFCIYYLCMRAQGITLDRVAKRLSRLDAAQRDALVRRFVSKITSSLHIRRPCRDACVGSQCCGKRVLQ
jgi:hypothetical protein